MNTYYQYKHVPLSESASKATQTNEWPNHEGLYKVTLCDFVPTENVNGTYDLKNINLKLKATMLQSLWFSIKDTIIGLWLNLSMLLLRKPSKDSKRLYQHNDLTALDLSPDMFLEYGTPIIARDITHIDAIKRLMTVDMYNVCACLYHVKLVHDIHTDIYSVVGYLKPLHSRGEKLKNFLDQGSEEIAFSLRSITNGKDQIKTIKNIVTFDVIPI